MQNLVPGVTTPSLTTRILMTALVYMMLQGVLFGFGAMLILGTPLAAHAMALMPWMIGVTALVALPLSWMLVPYLRTRRENQIARQREHLNLPGVGQVS
ncbi:hypothetical protein [Dongia sedimenti]|uniref:DUF2798 domain-containing protein n=1 Tax=Dongia sedimenti TaxID=3064282 RepID=A0ABU0YKE9_9PROT|nr:hypothetical protein [Rhodospirillaceae bacterium R-7]